MVTHSQGTKKSGFPGLPGVPAGSYFDFVINGTNWRIKDTDFYAALGVSGTIVQAGKDTATPILDTQLTVNRIRNLETDGNSGVKATVSPTEGVYLSLDAQTVGTGVAVLNPKNHIRRIRGGAGIAVGLSGDDILIAVSAAGASNVVIISALEDFPTPIAGVITLAASTVYFIQETVDIGANRFVLSSSTVMTGLSSIATGIVSTTTSPLFTNSGGHANEISRLNVTAPSAVIFDISGAGGSFNALDVFITSCVSVAVVSGVTSFRITEVVAAVCSGNAYELTSVTSIRFADIAVFVTGGHFCNFAGVNDIALFTSIFVQGYTGTLFKLNAATFENFFLWLVDAHSTNPANLFIDGVAGSANIDVGGVGTTENVNIVGTFTGSANILSSDIRWNLAATANNIESDVTALLSMQANATDTVIAVAGTPVLVAGTWVVEHDSKMTGTTGGRATYDAPDDKDVPITASVSVEPSSGGAVTISAQIAVNGVAVAGSKRSASASAGNAASITIPWNVILSTTDYIEIFVANESSTVDVLVSSAVLSAG